MSNDLATSNKLVDIAPHISDAQFNKLASSNKFLPRIQLYGSSSKLTKLGKISQGHWGLVKGKDNVTDLGTNFDCIVIQYRSKALDMRPEKPVQYFDDNSDKFKEVVEASSEKDSGCMWGPDFLLWLPQQETFATMFFANPTMRNSADDVKKLHGRGCTFGVRLIDTKKYTWHGPEVSICSTPMKAPPMDVILYENARFTKVESGVLEPEDVEEDDNNDTRAR